MLEQFLTAIHARETIHLAQRFGNASDFLLSFTISSGISDNMTNTPLPFAQEAPRPVIR